MPNFEKMSYKELVEMRRRSVPGGDIYEQLTQEINRIQQDTNNNQIANLTEEIKILKEIADKNLRTSDSYNKSSKRIAIAALLLGGVSAIFAILQTPIGYNHQCFYTGSAELKNQTERCESYVRLGVFDKLWEDTPYHPVEY